MSLHGILLNIDTKFRNVTIKSKVARREHIKNAIKSPLIQSSLYSRSRDMTSGHVVVTLFYINFSTIL